MKTLQKLGNFAKECNRVLKVTRKPNKDEFVTVVKAAGLGILIIGFIGFLIYMLSIPLNTVIG